MSIINLGAGMRGPPRSGELGSWCRGLRGPVDVKRQFGRGTGGLHKEPFRCRFKIWMGLHEEIRAPLDVDLKFGQRVAGVNYAAA